ncbi:MAG TPA: acyl-CoA thioesterase domain-containing protein [Acidimicrobiales bacterium]
MTLQRYPYRARAWWGEALLAESDACLYLEREREPALLYFPRTDIDLSLFHLAGRTPESAGGEAEVWNAESDDGEAVLFIVAATSPGLESLLGHGRFDTERARVEVLDGYSTGEADASTAKRFPTWGDATHLVDLLNVRPDGDFGFVGAAHTDGHRPVVEGSQMLGQAIVAAGRHAPERRVVSASMLFLRAADAGRPVRFELSELSTGRTFTGLAVDVLQDGRRCAAGTLLLDATAPEIIRHAGAQPDVPGPSACPPLDMGVTGRDIRVADGAYTNDSDEPAGPPTIDCWVRFHRLPEDPSLHAGLLAQFTGHMSIAAALRPHAGIGQAEAHRTLSMGINAISLSFHRAVRADEWMLYHHQSTFAGDGMTHAECRVHAESGDLLASFTVDAMVRRFPTDDVRDERRAM